MSNQRFPYERSRWRSGERDTARQWHEALERVGVESVRIRLTQVNCSSASAMALGTENTVIRGFAEEWLAWHEAQKAEKEQAFRSSQLFATRWAAAAASIATIAVIAAAIGWVLTAWLHRP
jgi:hypothetical protein